jgi:hypothetical protein
VAEPRAVATGKRSSSGVRLSFGKVAREKRRDRKKLFAANVCSQGPSENWPGRTASDFSSQAGALRLADISQVRPPLFNPFLPRFGFNPYSSSGRIRGANRHRHKRSGSKSAGSESRTTAAAEAM